jgi:D-alanyl-D-alanine carboxypeptidase/D-alanyl-D-alanine-endopeptidase (penicillin-binding protein 4)
MGGSWDGGLAVADPARCATEVFRNVLETNGIRVTGGVSTSTVTLPAGARVLVAHDSPSVAEMIRVVNKESQNLHAEMILRTARFSTPTVARRSAARPWTTLRAARFWAVWEGRPWGQRP